MGSPRKTQNIHAFLGLAILHKRICFVIFHQNVGPAKNQLVNHFNLTQQH